MSTNYDVVCFGAAVFDKKALALDKIISQQKNKVIISETMGGVARNIAESLTRLDCQVALVSRLGCDLQGETMLCQLKKLRINTSYITKSSYKSTGTYIAVLEANGDLSLAIYDLDICNEITKEVLQSSILELKKFKVWLFDTNINIETLEFLASEIPPQTLFIAVVATASQAKRIKYIAHKLDYLILNESEFAYLVNQTLKNEEDLIKAAKEVLNWGIKNIIVTRGDESVLLANYDNGCHFIPVKKVNVVDVTGAGDAFSAAFVYGLLKQNSLFDCVKFGINAASLTIVSTSSVSSKLNESEIYI